MKRNTRRRWIGMLSLGLIAVTAIVVVLAVFAGTNDDRFTAVGYSDVIRFQADGVATLQVKVFDLSGKLVWDSSVVSGDTIDWDRRNDTGERLAYGAYIYSAQGWNAQGDLSFQKNGKLALMLGDQVQLQTAPPVVSSIGDGVPSYDVSLRPMAVDVDHSTESWSFGQVGIGTTDPDATLTLGGSRPTIHLTGTDAVMKFESTNSWNNLEYKVSGVTKALIGLQGNDTIHIAPGFGSAGISVTHAGEVGINTATPTATLEIHGSATNLLALYDPAAPGDPKFRVTKTGEVRADGAYYGASYNTGSADVAERINVSEWVEAGCVVEIDPGHPGFFRKSSTPYSTKVAGIISTSPGVILGNSFDEATDDWEDNRPVLAVTGRVPCTVSAENGPIQIGDLLVASSTSGVAMKGNPEESMGAVVGKAMEPLKVGTGTIVVQVMLR